MKDVISIAILTFVLVFVGLSLAGCSGNPETPMVTVVAKADPAPVPAECIASDPSWLNLPDQDATQSAVVRNYAENKRRYRRVIGNRNICRAGLKAAANDKS